MNVIPDSWVPGLQALDSTDALTGLHRPRPLTKDIEKADLNPNPCARAPDHEPRVLRIISVRKGLSHNVAVAVGR
jgi:hypothetical protein